MTITLASGKSVASAPGQSLLDSLKQAGIYLTSSCGGKGTCGKCRIIIRKGLAEIRSKMKLSPE